MLSVLVIPKNNPQEKQIVTSVDCLLDNARHLSFKHRV